MSLNAPSSSSAARDERSQLLLRRAGNAAAVVVTAGAPKRRDRARRDASARVRRLGAMLPSRSSDCVRLIRPDRLRRRGRQRLAALPADRDHPLDRQPRARRRSSGRHRDAVLQSSRSERSTFGSVVTFMYAHDARSFAAKNRFVGFSRRRRCRIPTSVATMNSSASEMRRTLDHPFGREDLHALGIDVAGRHRLEHARRAAALGVNQELRAADAARAAARMFSGSMPACT